MSSRQLTTALLLIAAACSTEPASPDPEASPATIKPATGPKPVSNLISDGRTDGAAGFYFLFPIVPERPPKNAPFDTTATPTVSICRMAAGVCAETVAEFPYSDRPGFKPGTVRQQGKFEFYLATWVTPRSAAGKRFRATVSARGSALGYADIQVVSRLIELFRVPDDYVGIVAGWPLPIPFRIEALPPKAVSDTVDAAGGRVALPGVGSIVIPAGSLEGPTEVTIETGSSLSFDQVAEDAIAPFGAERSTQERLRISFSQPPADYVVLGFQGNAPAADRALVAMVATQHESDLATFPSGIWMLLDPPDADGWEEANVPAAFFRQDGSVWVLEAALGTVPVIEDSTENPATNTFPRARLSAVPPGAGAKVYLTCGPAAALARWRAFLSPPLRQAVPMHVESPANPWRMRNDIAGPHNGADLRAVFEPVYAMVGGTVTYLRTNRPGAGNWLGIMSGRFLHRYLHLSQFAPGLAVGVRVVEGQLIGTSGESGSPREPHLHIEAGMAGISPTDRVQAGIASHFDPISCLHWDLVTDFDAVHNPSGSWTYGYSSAAGAPSPFTAYPFSLLRQTTPVQIPSWGGQNTAFPFPYLAVNPTPDDVLEGTSIYSARSAVFHPAPDGRPAVIRWAPPTFNPKYGAVRDRFTLRILGRFFDGPQTSVIPATSDVHLWSGTTGIFGTELSGAALEVGFDLSTAWGNDTVSAWAGFGPNGNYNFDHTGIQLLVEPVPVP